MPKKAKKQAKEKNPIAMEMVREYTSSFVDEFQKYLGVAAFFQLNYLHNRGNDEDIIIFENLLDNWVKTNASDTNELTNLAAQRIQEGDLSPVEEALFYDPEDMVVDLNKATSNAKKSMMEAYMAWRRAATKLNGAEDE